MKRTFHHGRPRCIAGWTFALLLLVILGNNAAVAKDLKNNFTTGSLEVSAGVTIDYAEHGNEDGLPVILLHGYTDSWHSFEFVLEKFPNEYRVFSLTLRGHGESSKPDAGYALRDLAADVAAFITKKKLGRCVVAGHSLGGIVAQEFALSFPQHIRALIIISSDSKFSDNPGMPEFLGEAAKLRDPVAYSFAEDFQNSTLANPIDSARVNFFVRETMKVPARVWNAIADGLIKADCSTRLNTIEVPVLVLWGTRDAMCPAGDQTNLVKEMKNSRLIVYEGTGHALHWEEGDRFVNDVSEFLRELKMDDRRARR